MSQSRRSSGGASGAAGSRRGGSESQAGGGGEMDALLLGRTRELSTTGSGFSDSTWRNWRGAALSLVVIAALCGLIVAAILLLAPPNGLGISNRPSSRITLEDLSSDLSDPSIANGSWVSGISFAYLSPEGALKVVEATSGRKTRLLEATIIHRLGVRSWSLAPDLRHLLMQIWDGSHIIYDLDHGSQYDLHEKHSLMQWAEWGPNPTQMVFVQNHDLFYCSTVGADAVRLTSSGTRRRINARLNSFYAKRVFGAAGGDTSARGLWWAPKGKRIAYVTSDEAAVDDLVIVRYTSSYPTLHRIPFPKPGGALPVVTLWVQSLEPSSTPSPPTVVAPPPELRKDRSFYLTSVSWMNETRLAVAWSSFMLKIAFISLCDVFSNSQRISCITLVRQPTETSCPFLGGLTPGSSSASYIFYLSPYGKYCRQVARIALRTTESDPSFLTKGEFQAERIEGHDPSRGILFLRVRPETRRWERTLIELQCAGDAPHTNIHSCLLCGQTEGECPVPEAVFSPGGSKHFVLTCRGRSFWPTVTLWSSSGPVQLAKLDDTQSGFKEALEHKARPRTTYVQLNLSMGRQAVIPVLLPPATNSALRSSKYPLVLAFVPEHEFSRPSPVDFFAFLSATRHYACALLDPEYAEDVDFILRDFHLAEVDVGPRIGIWSRGAAAFHTLKEVLQSRPSLRSSSTTEATHPTASKVKGLECLVALSPITDWQRADAVQAGRYLQQGERSALIEVRSLNSSQVTAQQQIMIVHGTADEEVPVEHSLRLVRRLVEQSWLHRLLLYPDEGKDLPLAHLHAATDAFLHRCLRHPDIVPAIPPFVGKASGRSK